MSIRNFRESIASLIGLTLVSASLFFGASASSAGGADALTDGLIRVSLDVDGNGSADALTDGLLILRFSWKPSRNLTSQNITILKTPSNGGAPTACFTITVSPTSKSYNVSRTKLANCGNEIFFRVSGKTTKGKSLELNSGKISTLPPPSATNVTISSSSQNSALVTWSSRPGTSTASSFTIKLSNGSTKEVSATTLSANFTGLKVGEKISATVHANIRGVISLLKEIPGKKIVTVGEKPPTLAISNLITFTCPKGANVSESGCLSPEISTAAQAQYSYSCPSGGNVSGSTCVTGGSVPAVGIPGYLCPTGTLVGTLCMTPGTNSTATSTTLYTCPAGSALVGTTCSSTFSPATSTYACPSGQTLSGAYCGSTSSYPASGSSFFGFSCSSGGLLTNTLSGWICTTTNYYNANVLYSCPTGGVASGSVCATNTITLATPTTSYTCPSGGTLSGSTCLTNSTISASISYSCSPSNVLSGSSCASTSTYSASGSAFTGYSCTQGGTLTNSSSGSTCTLTTYFSATANYSCPSGYLLNGSNCSTTSTTSATATVTYSCPAGSTLSGSNCTNNSTAAISSTIYSCPYGTTLSGTSCVTPAISTNAVPTTSYSCPSGGVVSGANCITPTSTTAATASINYVCTSGTLVGTSCVLPSVAITPLTITQVSTLITSNATSVTENHIPYLSPFDTTVCATPYEVEVIGSGGQINQQLFCLRTH